MYCSKKLGLNVQFSYDFFLELVHIQTTNANIYIHWTRYMPKILIKLFLKKEY